MSTKQNGSSLPIHSLYKRFQTLGFFGKDISNSYVKSSLIIYTIKAHKYLKKRLLYLKREIFMCLKSCFTSPPWFWDRFWRIIQQRKARHREKHLARVIFREIKNGSHGNEKPSKSRGIGPTVMIFARSTWLIHTNACKKSGKSTRRFPRYTHIIARGVGTRFRLRF